jgi:hypothetical protein
MVDDGAGDITGLARRRVVMRLKPRTIVQLEEVVVRVRCRRQGVVDGDVGATKDKAREHLHGSLDQGDVRGMHGVGGIDEIGTLLKV